MPKVLFLLAEGFEELEAIAPLDLLRRAGIEVTVAALSPGIHVTGRCGLTVHADTLLDAVAEHTLFDALVLPGGPGVKHLRADPRVRSTVLAHHAGGRWIAAICAAPTVLLDAGLLSGRRYTAHPSVALELPERLGEERVVIDGRILTSRGAGTALDFGFALVEQLTSTGQSHEVSQAICA